MLCFKQIGLWLLALEKDAVAVLPLQRSPVRSHDLKRHAAVFFAGAVRAPITCSANVAAVFRLRLGLQYCVIAWWRIIRVQLLLVMHMSPQNITSRSSRFVAALRLLFSGALILKKQIKNIRCRVQQNNHPCCVQSSSQ